MVFDKILETEEIKLRAMEPEDAALLYLWENDTKIWDVSSTVTPFSMKTLQKFLESDSNDIYVNKQLRLMIEDKGSGKTIGTIDLYDFDARNRRAGVGIFITEEFQNKGFGTRSLKSLLEYCKTILLLHQVYADIPEHNTISLQLFNTAGFSECGEKKDWILTSEGFENVKFFIKKL